jgi:hypothetical protein
MSASGADITTATSLVRIAARGISFNFAPHCGIISAFKIDDQGCQISMMHRAPWVGSGTTLPEGAPPHQAHLEGDFFCAPFSDASADNAPLHGWPANGFWQVSPNSDAKTLHCTLDHTVMGAKVAKELSLTDNHPFLYQCHSFIGGQGAISTANHAMISLPNGGHLRFSPKRWFETPEAAPETDPARGRSALRYPARSVDPRQFPGANGTTTDLTQYPFGPAHEDFVIGLESTNSPLGWTAVTRPQERDLYLSLRHPQRLPMTMLWHSNGGRDYPPWNGKHTACLGVEEGVALPLLDITARENPDIFATSGQASALVLAPYTTADVRHITGCIAWPTGEAVKDVILSGDRLTVIGDKGAKRVLPIRGDFLGL